MRAVCTLLCAAAGFVPAAAQDVPAILPPAAIHATPVDSLVTHLYLPDGQPLPLADLIARLDTTDVLFLGEQHGDAAGHAFQRLVFDAALDRYAGTRPVVLALEMFERDVQLVLDEYLAGLIREKDFLAAARPWSNYKADYRPLVEAARAHQVPVVASNAPARYVSRASRGEDMGALSDEARRHLPILPVESASEQVRAKFFGVMEGFAAMHGTPDPAGEEGSESDSLAVAAHPAMPEMDLDAMLAAQNLRDVSMAGAVREALGEYPGALIVHVNGSFHSEGRLGIPEHLLRQRPEARMLVLTLVPTDDPAAFDAAAHGGAGDVIALTGRLAPPVLPADAP